MFTGLVEMCGQLRDQSPMPGGKRMTFSHGFSGIQLGDSIAVCGACLTVVAFDDTSFTVELSNETLSLTILGDLQVGDEVNLERALAAGERLGGHMVTGHVDGMGHVTELVPEGDMTRVTLEVPAELSRYIAKKGSLTVDGVSLTINDVGTTDVQLLLIPHTQAVTNLKRLKQGTRVNLEVDLIARYIERLLATQTAAAGA